MLFPRLLIFGGDRLLLLAGLGDGGSCALVAVCFGGSPAIAPSAGCPSVSLVWMFLGSALYLYGMHGLQGVSRGAGFCQVGLDIEACFLVSTRGKWLGGLVLHDGVL